MKWVLFRLTLGIELCLGGLWPVVGQPGADPRLLRCVAFGDSTTASRLVDGHPLEVYATQLARRLAGEGVIPEVLNKGIPGNNTVDAWKRFERDVLSVRPHVVFIQFGINDSAVDVWKKPPAAGPRVPLETYQAKLRMMVRELRAIGAEVYLMTPNPLRWTPELRKLYSGTPYDPSDPDGFNVLLREYAEAVRQLAAEEKVRLVDVYQAFEEYGKVEGQSTDDLLLDGMHPNGRGHRLVADLIMERLNAP
ncbi:MAG: SGNH/GDSL hydrolase family protein [Acidobacteriota bacterium]